MVLSFDEKLNIFFIKSKYMSHGKKQEIKGYGFLWDGAKMFWYTEDVKVAMNLYLEADYKTRNIISRKLINDKSM